MAFERTRPNALGLRLLFGALVLALLAWLSVELVTRTHLYATALIVAVVAALIAAGMIRAAGRGDVALSQVLERLDAGSADRSVAAGSAFPALALAADRIADRLALQRREQQGAIDHLQALLDTTPAALLVLKDDGQIALANRAAFALAGRDARRLEDIAALGEGAAAIAAMPAGARAVVSAADGRKLYVSMSRLSRPGGETWRLAALQSVSGELDVVEQAAWRDLIRVLAHEMMNSLTPIASLSESLARQVQGDADTVEALQVIARRSANLMSFVDRYRAVADLPRPVVCAVALGPLIGDVERLARASAGERAVALRTEVVPPGLTVAADPQMLEQALINLVKNALDATAGLAAPSVTVTCAQTGGMARIAVADNGEGVKPGLAEAIFVPFYSTRPGGAGIGLSLARQIVLAHGGQLTQRPNTPTGAVFEIVLPVAGA